MAAAVSDGLLSEFSGLVKAVGAPETGGLLELPSVSWPGGSPENTGLIIAVVIGAYLLTLWISALIWTMRDIRQRADDPVSHLVAVVLVLLFNFPGWVLYRVLRPPQTLKEQAERRLEDELVRGLQAEPALSCSRCHTPVEADYIACPGCAVRLKRVCGGCERALAPEWVACPWCAHRVAELQPAPQPTPQQAAIEPPAPEPDEASEAEAAPPAGSAPVRLAVARK